MVASIQQDFQQELEKVNGKVDQVQRDLNARADKHYNIMDALQRKIDNGTASDPSEHLAGWIQFGGLCEF